MKVQPKAHNSVDIEVYDAENKLVGVFTLYDDLSTELELRIVKQVPNEKGDLVYADIEVEKTAVGAVLR